MDDDLNAAKAIGLVFDRIRDLNRALDAGDRDDGGGHPRRARRASASPSACFSEPAALLDDLRTPRPRQRAGLSEDEIEAAIAGAERRPQAADFNEADAIRARLSDQGIVLEDGAGGTTWKAGLSAPRVRPSRAS